MVSFLSVHLFLQKQNIKGTLHENESRLTITLIFFGNAYKNGKL